MTKFHSWIAILHSLYWDRDISRYHQELCLFADPRAAGWWRDKHKNTSNGSRCVRVCHQFVRRKRSKISITLSVWIRLLFLPPAYYHLQKELPSHLISPLFNLSQKSCITFPTFEWMMLVRKYTVDIARSLVHHLSHQKRHPSDIFIVSSEIKPIAKSNSSCQSQFRSLLVSWTILRFAVWGLGWLLAWYLEMWE